MLIRSVFFEAGWRKYSIMVPLLRLKSLPLSISHHSGVLSKPDGCFFPFPFLIVSSFLFPGNYLPVYLLLLILGTLIVRDQRGKCVVSLLKINSPPFLPS